MTSIFVIQVDSLQQAVGISEDDLSFTSECHSLPEPLEDQPVRLSDPFEEVDPFVEGDKGVLIQDPFTLMITNSMENSEPSSETEIASPKSETSSTGNAKSNDPQFEEPSGPSEEPFDLTEVLFASNSF